MKKKLFAKDEYYDGGYGKDDEYMGILERVPCRNHSQVLIKSFRTTVIAERYS